MDLSNFTNAQLTELWDKLPTDPSTLEKLNQDQLAELWHAAKDTVDLLEKWLKTIRSYAMAKQTRANIDSLLMQRLQDTGATSIATPNGTIHTVGRTSARIMDPEAFQGFVIENRAWDMIDWKANMTACRDFIEKETTAVPGVELNTYRTLSITVPKAPMKRLSDGK